MARSINASRDLHEEDKKVGISTDDGDIEVHADFLPSGREDAPLDLPPGGWEDRLCFENYGQDRTPWLYTAITRARERIVVVKDDNAAV